MRILNHLPEITEALRELEEGLARGATRAAVAADLNVSEQELERIENAFLGMNVSQIEHVLRVEAEAEELRGEIAELRQADIDGARRNTS